MDVEVFDVRDELGKGIEAILPFHPVVVFDPVRTERFHEAKVGAVGPATFEPVAFGHFMPDETPDTLHDIVELLTRHIDLEALHGVARAGLQDIMSWRARTGQSAACA